MNLLFALVLLSSLVVRNECVAGHQQQKQRQRPDPLQDLIKVHETGAPISWLGVKHTDLAPESQVVGIQFDVNDARKCPRGACLLVDQASLRQQPAANRTKQSQEFETHQTTSAPAELVQTSTGQPANPNAPTSSSSSTASASTTVSLDPVVTTIATTSPTTTSSLPAIVTLVPQTSTSQSPEEQNSTPGEPSAEPVGSRTTRSGAAVLCGEANPSGKSNKNLDRIVGGHKSEPGEFPFQVRLNIRSRRGSGICGGVILDERHILTAAHCMTACVSQFLVTATIENTGVKATIGDHSIRSSDGEQEIDIEKIVPHEKYDACNFYANDHDIALIRTSKPIVYRFTSDGYGSINRPCMPRSNGTAAYADGDQVIVSGWGVTRENSGSLSNILRYVQVPVVSVARCQETYGTRVTHDHVCAGFPAGGKDSCQGDSGGPLVRVVENRYELVGIVSFGYGCGQPSAPGVYTRVASYVDWIAANI